MADLNQHIEYQDVQAITQLFDLKEKEKTLPGNCLLTSIYTKLALKNLWYVWVFDKFLSLITKLKFHWDTHTYFMILMISSD